MENLLLSAEEHNFLIANKQILEDQNDVKIDVPNFINDCKLGVNDIIFATISGNASGIEKIKDFMHQRKKDGVSGCEKNNASSYQRDIPLVTLSDSDSETLSVLQEHQNQHKVVLKRRKKGRVFSDADDLTVSPNATNENIKSKGRKRKRVLFDSVDLIDSVDLTVSPNVTNENICEVKGRKKEKVLLDTTVDLTVSPIVRNENSCDVSSTTNEPDLKKRKMENIQFTAILPVSLEINGNYPVPQGKSNTNNVKLHSHLPRKFELKKSNDIKRSREISRKRKKNQRKKCRKSPAEDFISLRTENANSCNNQKENDTEEIICLDQATVEKPLPKDPKLLRPIVIDGSNVAREHGKATNTFSSKGIQICVQFFLERGHTSVTAFVPNFRRHCLYGNVATTDENILEELAKSSHVVFTPSRKVNGKRVTCYDDRFIVELASKNGGVILSNDNYKDLLDVSEAFKKTIEERLLMFCFVGDLLMVPDDPLGRNGPRLNELLSFPES